VALLVLAVGFMAMATLQGFSLSRGNDSLTHQMGVIQTYSVLDIMRGDLANAKAGAYNTTVKTSACPAGGGNGAAEALSEWCGQLGQSLGVDAATQGAISCTNIGLCTVTVTYNDKRAGTGTGTTRTITTTTFL
jgi:type IV pilus assembly protein PilV